MANLLAIAKMVFLLGLCVLWGVFFAGPAFERYLTAGVSVEEWQETPASLPPPAVTLCPFERYFSGWKNAIKQDFTDNYDNYCSEAASSQDFEKCVEEKTFSLFDTISNGSYHGIAPQLMKQNLSDPSFWVGDSTVGALGRCYTLNYTGKLGADVQDHSLVFNLNTKMSYSYFIHHADFFTLAWNPLTLPIVKGELFYDKVGNKLHYFYLRAIRQEKIDRAEQRCDPDPMYRFTYCVKEKVSEVVGCKLPWDNYTSGEEGALAARG